MLRGLLVVICSLGVVLPALAGGQKHNEGPGKLPPGLQKKAARGGELPPGWKDKLAIGQPLDRQVFDYGTVLKPANADGIIEIRVDNEIVRVLEDGLTIVDILSRY